jgi:predicted enzyme related to lactoylglutathione lyase
MSFVLAKEYEMANPFVHIELSTDDVDAAKQFYKSLFGWKLKDMPQQDYTMIDVGTGTGGGMMKKQMPEGPAMWLPYVQVDSVKKVVDKAKKAGATATVEYQSIGDMGAIGVLTDPTGAAFGVWEQGKAAKAAKAAPKRAKKKAARKKAPKKKPGTR